MSKIGKIKVKDINKLRENCTDPSQSATDYKIPKIKQSKHKANTTGNRKAKPETNDVVKQESNVVSTICGKKKRRSTSFKDPPANQKRIDEFFKSCQKTYRIEPLQRTNPLKLSQQKQFIKKRGRKRLFSETNKMKINTKKQSINLSSECVVISSGSEGDCNEDNKDIEIQKNSQTTTKENEKKSVALALSESNSKGQQEKTNSKCPPKFSCHPEECNKTNCDTTESTSNSTRQPEPSKTCTEITCSSRVNPKEDVNNNLMESSGKVMKEILHSKSSGEKSNQDNSSASKAIDLTLEATSKPPSVTSASVRNSKCKVKPCPPYKIIEGTTFAVDAFQFGYLEGVTHYFLTHFHADHYIGLTRKFSAPIYMSEITARLVQLFINLDKQYVKVLPLKEAVPVNDEITVTALDANHCPGAIMLLFQNLKTGQCTLHTGDFRANFLMETDPCFWNHNIHTLYLDTTYIGERYAFCTQDESVEKAKQFIEDFQKKHKNKKILYICGSYLIGKEKFWSALAKEYNWKVWCENNRYKALKALNDARLQDLMVENVQEAQLHVIAMVKVNYWNLVDYFYPFESQYDVLLALRPSGWEKNSKPQWRGKINIIGIEYSEHSSLTEMQRFVKFLKPEKVISTVPVPKDIMKTPEVPAHWYKYERLKPEGKHQSTITAYMTPAKRNNVNGIISEEHMQNFVSPLSVKKTTKESSMAWEMKEHNNQFSFKIPNELQQQSIDKVKNWLNTNPVTQHQCENESEIRSKNVAIKEKISSLAGNEEESKKNKPKNLILHSNTNTNDDSIKTCESNKILEESPSIGQLPKLTLPQSQNDDNDKAKNCESSKVLEESPSIGQLPKLTVPQSQNDKAKNSSKQKQNSSDSFEMTAPLRSLRQKKRMNNLASLPTSTLHSSSKKLKLLKTNERPENNADDDNNENDDDDDDDIFDRTIKEMPDTSVLIRKVVSFYKNKENLDTIIDVDAENDWLS